MLMLAFFSAVPKDSFTDAVIVTVYSQVKQRQAPKENLVTANVLQAFHHNMYLSPLTFQTYQR